MTLGCLLANLVCPSYTIRIVLNRNRLISEQSESLLRALKDSILDASVVRIIPNNSVLEVSVETDDPAPQGCGTKE